MVTSASLAILMPFCGSQQTVENSREMEIPDYLTGLLKNLYSEQEAMARTGHETMNFRVPKLGKQYIKAMYCHPAYLIYIQNPSSNWMNHKLESKLVREISTTSDSR